MRERQFTDCVDIVGASCKPFEGNRRYISTGAVATDHIDESDIEIVDYKSRPSRADLIVEPGTLLFAKMQGTKKTLYVDKEKAENIYSTGFFALKAKSGVISTRCLYHMLGSTSFLTQKDKNCSGATQKAITNAGLKKIRVSIPDYQLQEAIADQLDKISSVIQMRRSELQKLDDLVKARFVEMFGDEQNPFGWETVRVENVADVQVGVVIKPAQYYTDKNHGVKTFRSLNIGSMYIKDADWVYFTEEGNTKNSKSILKENDLLVVRSGAPGTACVVTSEYAGCNAVDIIIAHPNIEKVNPYYLCQYTNLPHGKKQIDEGTGGAAQQHFNVGKYNKLKLMLPPLEMQNDFERFLKQVDKSKFVESIHVLKLIKEAITKEVSHDRIR